MGGYLLNYSRWRALYESQQINESFDDIVIRLKRVDIGDAVSPITQYPRWAIDPKTNGAAYSLMTKTIGGEAIPMLYVGVGTSESATGEVTGFWNKIVGKNDLQIVFGATVVGIAQFAKNDKLVKDVNALEQFVTKVGVTTEKGEKVQLYGPSSDKIDTIGVLSRSGNSLLIKNTEKSLSSSIKAVCAYINAFNLQNWATGDFTQYDPTAILNKSNQVDLTGSNPGATVKQSGYLMLVSPASASVTAGSIGTETETVQGAQAQTGDVEIAFTTGRADIDDKGVKVDANHPKVKEIGDKIIGYLGDNGVIDSMTLTSSASPDYGSIKNVAGWDKSYPKGTTGTTDPGAGADDAGKNMKLAYDRGATFRAALYAYLGGHAKENSINLSWKISTDAPGGGKNISYSVSTKSEAPQTITKTVYQGAKVSVTKEDNAIIIYKIKYNAAAVAENKGGTWFSKEVVAYENLKVGDKIVVYAKDMKTKLGKDEAEPVTVSKIEDNNVYVNYKENTDILIPKDRYIKQLGKVKEKEAEI